MTDNKDDTLLPCHFCKRALKPIKKMGAERTINCKSCRAEQVFQPDNSLFSWSFNVGPYELSFHFGSMTLKITDRGPNKSFQYSLKEEPSYMTPDSMTEERIKSIVMFS
jgi:hypothetical protein